MTAGIALDPSAAPDPRAPQTPRPWWLRALRILGALLVAAAVIGSPWWGPRALSRLDFFHVRRIEFEGVRYGKANELVRALAVDTTQSVWQSMIALGKRVSAHPLVESATVERRLPGTLVVHVVERQPVAMVMQGGMLRPADATGTILPIDLARVPMDVPLASQPDSALLALLDGLRKEAPTLYARVSQAQRVGPDELRLMLGSLVVRTMPDVTVSRFRDILPVEADLARNRLRAVELDLRFRDQVIARQP